MLFYILSLSLISFIGVIVNAYLFMKFAHSKTKPFSSFHKLCLFKTIPNFTISSIFLFYAVPLASFQMTMSQIPRLQNLIVSQILGGFAYPLGPLIQICMSIDRFLILFFPFSKLRSSRIPFTNIVMVITTLLATGPIVASILSGCYLVYDPTILVFLPELEECSHSMDNGMFFTIFSLAVIANAINCVIFVKLLKDKMDGISAQQKSQRRKKWVSMFTQSVIQDFLQLIDMSNYNFVSRLVDTPWWSFIFCCLSFAMVYALDGLFGTVLNAYLFYRFSTRKGIVSGFYKLCLIKTIPNTVVCTCFLFWAVPLGSLRVPNAKVSRDANVLVGQVAGSGAYILGPLLHVCMAANRFTSLYFAVQIIKVSRFPITFLSISVAFVIAVVFTVMGLPEDCGFLYIPETLEWVSEDAECAAFQYNLLLYSIFGCAVISNSMNLATAARLLFDKVGGMSVTDSKRRRKKYIVNFSQSFLQDCLHVLDMINSTYTWKINPAHWFQFLCLSFSFVSIHMLDGCVMFYFHTEVHPHWLWKKTVKGKLVRVVKVSRVSTSEPVKH